VKHWLRSEIVGSSSPEVFKNRVHKHLSEVTQIYLILHYGKGNEVYNLQESLKAFFPFLFY